ncbi:hypothetical protein HOP50_09g54750 [Chloropicon primus]|uniref:F-box domain-containing protein n=1 Tax=Chloropicon primus TaxID=1764295 RepID=A0A5B8MR18_9CHLO|nr:hypothetical protein A3770_09p54440 [Chloropicon primus]UPR02150.1 hypothetical protein HOP50_09g54750 [Chloropicon primus]|eukprot:QDZ22926.1 hypothetical protein A3770_09p54440 [Chloropicon primus]
MMEETRESRRQRRKGRDALDVLPEWAWLLVLKQLDEYDHLAFGLTCRAFLVVGRITARAMANPSDHPQKETQKGLPLRTNLAHETLFKQMPRFSLSWFQWVSRSFKRRKGAPKELRYGEYYDHLYDCDLMYLAAFQGSKKVMEWLASQGISFGIERYYHGVVAVATGGAAAGGHIEILEWLGSEGCEFDNLTCSSAALGGHLDVLKWLRSQDPPCPWDWRTCEYAAEGGHLEVLQWARSQDPPCRWDPIECMVWAESRKDQHAIEWINANI